MHYIRALSLVASIGLAAVTAHARLQPRFVRLPPPNLQPSLGRTTSSQTLTQCSGEAGITGLPDASFAEGLYERDVDDGYERFYGSLHARDASALYEQGPEALPKRTPASVPSVDEIAALLPRAGNSRSGSGTKASKSRSVTPRPGWPLVSMGQAKFIMLGEGQGIETSGVLGCIAVGVVGSKGIVSPRFRFQYLCSSGRAGRDGSKAACSSV